MNHLLTTALLTFLAAGVAGATVPERMRYQGQLLDAEGGGLDGVVAIALEVYDAPTGGNRVYTQWVGSVSVRAGALDFAWGDAGLAPALTGGTCWLEVHVDDDILTPRQRLPSVPYAVRAREAADAAGLGGFPFANMSLPVGAIVEFGSPTPPAGYLRCDGAEVSRATYAALFAVIGTAYGAGDGSTTFHLPDYRGRFVRGANAGTGRDPNAGTRTASATGGNTGDAVGTLQTDELEAHTHSVDPPNTGTSTAGNHSHAQYVSANCNTGGSGHREDFDQDCGGLTSYTQGINTGTAGNHTHTVNIGAFSSASTGGAETRPVNIASTFIVKY